MKQTGGYDLVWLTIGVQERTNLDWMDDEWRVVHFPGLIRVAGRGELERGLREWQSRERECGALGSRVGAVRDHWMPWNRHQLRSRVEGWSSAAIMGPSFQSGRSNGR